uniref:adenylate cyclase n=1 Tax=Oryctolagus cuniculus TaxID=9986 RepID=A0A5F9CDV0_RABIT
MERVKVDNKRILFNLLPAHVAQHFLMSNPRNMDLYYQSYSQVGVMFASIPNFNDFYIELDGNNMGVECLRLLNEIIADFDELMDKDFYKDLEKIKTIGSTYMAAVGLAPTAGTRAKKSISCHLSALADFAIEMFDVLDEINYQSYNDFVLRVGDGGRPPAAEKVPLPLRVPRQSQREGQGGDADLLPGRQDRRERLPAQVPEPGAEDVSLRERWPPGQAPPTGPCGRPPGGCRAPPTARCPVPAPCSRWEGGLAEPRLATGHAPGARVPQATQAMWLQPGPADMQCREPVAWLSECEPRARGALSVPAPPGA